MSQKEAVLPFRELKFSSTSVPSSLKNSIASQIQALGGTFYNDLMADIDVLLVGDVDTPKYRFCAQKRYDIRFVKPDAIGLVYDEWLEGGVFGPEVLDQHLLPPFQGLSMCLSRLSNAQDKLFHRDYISALIKEYGGTPTESLTPSNSIVISIERSGKRYDKALEWGIPVAHPKWVLDCVCRGAILESKFYDITKLERDDIGKESCLIWDKLNITNDAYKFDRALYDKYNVKKDKTANKEAETRHNSCDVPDREPPRLLSGITFATYGFSESETGKLSDLITSHGGRVLDNESMVSYLIIPSKLAYRNLPSRLKSLNERDNVTIVNEWFIERTFFYGEVKNDTWSIPRNFCNLDLNLKISISGFSGVEHLHITKLIGLIGGTFAETFQKDCDLLVVNLSTVGLTETNAAKLFKYKYRDIVDDIPSSKSSVKSTKSKINAAKTWGISIVSLAYLWQITEKGVLPNIMEYRWCIFAPRSSVSSNSVMRRVQLHELADKRQQTPQVDKNLRQANSLDPETYNGLMIEHQQNQRQEASTGSSVFDGQRAVSVPTKLPSPKRNKLKQWPRLVGTATESQLRPVEANLFGKKRQAAVASDEDDEPETKISYGEAKRRLTGTETVRRSENVRKSSRKNNV